MLSDGRSDRTRFRCTRLFMSRDHDQALTPVRGIGILVLLVLCGGTIPSRSVRSGRDGKPDGKPRSSSPGRSSQRDRASPGRGSQRDKRTPSPKSPRRQSPAGPADRVCWEYTKTGKCQYGRECRFEHDKSPRNPAAPSTPRTGDRPVRDKPMFFGYCYDWMYGKCTAQPCKYLHQKPLPGTKPITPRATAGPVVEDEEGDTPRSPTPSPPDREARRFDSPAQGLTDF